MAYGDWDKIIRQYQELLTYDSIRDIYLAHARAMLDLIPEIRKNSAFDGVIPFTSHTTLCFEHKEHRIRVCIWYEQGKYKIYLSDPSYYPTIDTDYLEKRRVIWVETNVIENILTFLDYARTDSALVDSSEDSQE